MNGRYTRAALTVMFAVVALVFAGAGASAQTAAPAAPRISGHGDAAVLIAPNTAPLYYYDKDQRGQSNCYAACASSWPPFIAKPGAAPHGRFSLVKRRDGKQQWAYNGHPLYTWKNDEKGGSRAAYPISPDWHVAHPAHM